MQPKYKLNDRTHLVSSVRRADDITLDIDGHLLDVRYQRLSKHHVELAVNGAVYQAYVAQDDSRLFVHLDGKVWQLDALDEFNDANDSGVSGGCISAPMPGVVIEVYVEAGQRVDEGNTLMLIESMKLQTEIKAMAAGVVKKVGAESGSSFNKGAVLVEIAADKESAETGEVR